MTNFKKTGQVKILNSIKGFTLIELVVTIVISAVLAGGTIAYIANTVDGIESASRRNKLATAGRVVIDRIALELHNALPNSIRASTALPGGNQCIEYIPVLAATTYINPAFTGLGSTAFNVVDFVENGADYIPASSTGIYAVIYPRRINQVYDGDNGAVATWPSFPNRRPIQTIASIADTGPASNLSVVTLTTAHRFNRRSPNERFFVVTQPVSFCVVGDKIYRYSNYGFYRNQSVAERLISDNSCPAADPDRCLPNYNTSPDKVLITDSLNNAGLTAFAVRNQNLTRNSLVAIQLNMESGEDSFTLTHEVLTRSVP
jgi:MSHA biogenesis protein MshO